MRSVDVVFTGVDVRHDPDVARVFEFECPGHVLF